MRQRMGANGYRRAGKWLRGVDLNHRPLGYEFLFFAAAFDAFVAISFRFSALWFRSL